MFTFWNLHCPSIFPFIHEFFARHQSYYYFPFYPYFHLPFLLCCFPFFPSSFLAFCRVFFFPQLSCKWRIVTTVNSTISNVSICLSFFFKHKIYTIILILDRKWDSFLELFTLLLNSHCVSAKLICGGGIIDLNTPIAYFTWGVCWMLDFIVNWWRNSQQTKNTLNKYRLPNDLRCFKV